MVAEDADSRSRSGPLVADRRRFLQAGAITGFGAAALASSAGATVAARYDVAGPAPRHLAGARVHPPALANGTDLAQEPEFHGSPR